MEPITLKDGAIELSPDERRFWLARFGDAQLLELALIAAAADIVPNPRGLTPYTARVRSMLARMAYGTIERKGRYQAPKQTVSRSIRDTSEPWRDYVARVNGKR